MNSLIYEDSEIYVEIEKSEIPWLKIFTKEPYKELGDVPKPLRLKLFEVYDIIEDEMKSLFHQEKDEELLAAFLAIQDYLAQQHEDDEHEIDFEGGKRIAPWVMNKRLKSISSQSPKKVSL